MKLNNDLIDFENMSISSDHSFCLDVLEGLSANPKFIPAKYHYDDKGSRLFQKITDLTEYYPTRCELDNLKNFKHEFSQLISDKAFRLIELGVGDAHKTKILLQHFVDLKLKFEYIPIDCCHEVISNVTASLQKEYTDAQLKIFGITADYFSALKWLETQTTVRNVVLFLGSNIGNFTPEEAKHFLHHIWGSLKNGDYILFGFDLKKDINILQNAYNDKLGITEEFNLNILDRMNKELGSNFNCNKFKYHSFYNPQEGRIESWLISTEGQTITVPSLQKSFYFQAWEGIHVENSYKYNLKEIEALAHATGFVIKDSYIDNKGYFAEVVWEVKKMPQKTLNSQMEAHEQSTTSTISED